MRFIYFTDSHISSKNPNSRTDDYVESIIKKLSEIVYVANSTNVDYIICGGDLFHSPTPTPNSVMVANKVSQIFLKSKAPIYVVPGNHDQYGYNNQTLDKTLLGIYIANKVVNVLDRENPLLLNINGNTVAIEGQEYKIGIDKYKNEDFLCNIKADYNILVSHAMVSDSLVSNYYKKNEVDHIDLNDIKTNANLILTGHEHNGYKAKEINNTIFVNPGSLSRTDRSLKHDPSYLYFEIDDSLKLKMAIYKLKTAKPYEEVFNLEDSESKKDKNKLLENFKNELLKINKNKNISIENIMTNIVVSNNIEKSVLDKAYEYMANANENSKETSHTIKPYKLLISNVEIDNFQSHKHTVVTFSNGLNSIIGLSDSGKTSIRRAIEWCLYNIPRGNEFMRVGEKETSVKVAFNDGSYIIRKRDTKKSGSYTVCDSNGNIKEFEGFGNNAPAEIINEHQMPILSLSKDFNCNINIVDQFEKPFLLKETPSIKAAAIGKITNTDKIDYAIKTVSSDKKNVQKEIKILEKQRLDKELELSNYDDLKNTENNINNIDAIVNIVNILEKEISSLIKYKKDLDILNANICAIENKLNSLIDIDLVENKIGYAKKALEDYSAIFEHHFRYKDICSKINQTEEKISHNINYDVANNIVDNIKSNISILENISQQKQDINKIESRIDEAQVLHKRTIENEINIKNSIKKIENTINEELNKIEKCPTCGKALTMDDLEYIINI